MNNSIYIYIYIMFMTHGKFVKCSYWHATLIFINFQKTNLLNSYLGFSEHKHVSRLYMSHGVIIKLKSNKKKWIFVLDSRLSCLKTYNIYLVMVESKGWSRGIETFHWFDGGLDPRGDQDLGSGF
jgi:hypothetical protein